MTDISELVASEIADFCAGLGSPGEPETPKDIQRQLLRRILPLLKDERRDWVARGAVMSSEELADIAKSLTPHSSELVKSAARTCFILASRIRAGEVDYD